MEVLFTYKGSFKRLHTHPKLEEKLNSVTINHVVIDSDVYSAIVDILLYREQKIKKDLERVKSDL